jgi:hypothetical protein
VEPQPATATAIAIAIATSRIAIGLSVRSLLDRAETLMLVCDVPAMTSISPARVSAT